MIIRTDAWVPFPRALVYSTYRDRLLELVPYMPNIRQIELKTRQENGSQVEMVNEWHGGGEIPAAARAILDESMLSWTEQALWDESLYTTDWRIQTHAFTDAVSCTGKNRFIDQPNGTLIQSRGELSIDPSKIREVPQFLAGMVGKVVEDFLGKKIEPNLQQMSEGVRRYLEQQTSSPSA